MKLPKELQKKGNKAEKVQEDGTPIIMAKWEALIKILKKIISKKGEQLVVINVPARMDSAEQFEEYQRTCEIMKGDYNKVVTTGFRGEERVFWVNQNIQFYIREGEQKIHATGNREMFKLIVNSTSKDTLNYFI